MYRYFLVYQIALNYINPQSYQLDSTLLIELIKDNLLDITRSLIILSFMHEEYLTELLKNGNNKK